VSFAAITLCVASQWVFVVVISLSTQSGNFCIYPCMNMKTNKACITTKNDIYLNSTHCSAHISKHVDITMLFPTIVSGTKTATMQHGKYNY